MYHHAPQNYSCPICLGVQGIENEETLIKRADQVYQDDLVCAFINSFWIETAEGHVIVVPNAHYENLYEIPAHVGHRIFDVSRMLALAIKKAYRCDGITTRQNNEPAANQHAFHYHLHIFPRYDGDRFNENMLKKGPLSNPEERKAYARKIKEALA